MHLRHPLKVGLIDGFGMSRIFDEIDVVDVSGRMELRHEQRIHVPKFGFDQRAAHLLKSHADELRFDGIQKFAVGMFFPVPILGARRLMVYFRKRLLRQAPSFSNSGLSCDTSSMTPRVRDLFGRHALGRQRKRRRYPIIHPKRFLRIATLHGVVMNELLEAREKASSPRSWRSWRNCAVLG